MKKLVINKVAKKQDASVEENVLTFVDKKEGPVTEVLFEGQGIQSEQADKDISGRGIKETLDEHDERITSAEEKLDSMSGVEASGLLLFSDQSNGKKYIFSLHIVDEQLGYEIKEV